MHRYVKITRYFFYEKFSLDSAPFLVINLTDHFVQFLFGGYLLRKLKLLYRVFIWIQSNFFDALFYIKCMAVQYVHNIQRGKTAWVFKECDIESNLHVLVILHVVNG